MNFVAVNHLLLVKLGKIWQNNNRVKNKSFFHIFLLLQCDLKKHFSLHMKFLLLYKITLNFQKEKC